MVDQPTNVEEATAEGQPVYNPANINSPENIDPDAGAPDPVNAAPKKATQETEDRAIAVFAKKSGFKKSDVIDYRKRGASHVFVTEQGGKYELRGDRLRTVQGPRYPNE